MSIDDLYRRLGVTDSASREEIRAAYRRLARENHPDKRGDDSAFRMTQINEAWRVLSDPARRAVYDARPRNNSTSGSAAPPHGSIRVDVRDSSRSTVRLHTEPSAATPARFPWRLMVIVAAVGIAFVLVNAALTRPGEPPAPDNLMEVGSCVEILDNGDAKEVLCNGANDGVVADLRPVNSICPLGTELHRDRQGMGDICVRLAAG